MQFPACILAILITASAPFAYAGEKGEGAGEGIAGVGAISFAVGTYNAAKANTDLLIAQGRFDDERMLIQNTAKRAYTRKQQELAAKYKALEAADQSTPERAAAVQEKKIQNLRLREMLDITRHTSPEEKLAAEKVREATKAFYSHCQDMERVIRAHRGVMLGGAAAMAAGGSIYMLSHDEKIETPPAEKESSEAVSAELGE